MYSGNYDTQIWWKYHISFFNCWEYRRKHNLPWFNTMTKDRPKQQATAHFKSDYHPRRHSKLYIITSNAQTLLWSRNIFPEISRPRHFDWVPIKIFLASLRFEMKSIDHQKLRIHGSREDKLFKTSLTIMKNLKSHIYNK